jgi:hypothetical protein
LEHVRTRRAPINLIGPLEERAAAALPLGQRTPAAAQAAGRLSIDLPAELHTRIQVICARRGAKIADEGRAFRGAGQVRPGEVVGPGGVLCYAAAPCFI